MARLAVLKLEIMLGFSQRPPQVCLLRRRLLSAIVFLSIGAMTFARPGNVLAQDKSTGSAGVAQVAKAVGKIKSIQADSILVTSESGGEVTVKLTGSTKILRVPPGEKDLKSATVLQMQDLQPGDRVLVRGQASADGHTIAALAVIVMKQSDVTAKLQHDRDDWQKRGVGGLVTAVGVPTGTLTISSGSPGTTHNIAVHVTPGTILRRYAPDSVNFDDATPEPVDHIKVGDQLRARGTRSADGSELAAEEVVSGSFRNIAGTIKAIDATADTMTVQDAISKSEVVVKVTPGSQLKKLPPEMAQRIAMRLKSTAGDGNGNGPPGGNGRAQTPGNGQGTGTGADGARASSGGAGPPGGSGTPDFQRLL